MKARCAAVAAIVLVGALFAAWLPRGEAHERMPPTSGQVTVSSIGSLMQQLR